MTQWRDELTCFLQWQCLYLFCRVTNFVTNFCSELDRMVDETNNWLKQPEAQAKLNRLAERLTHKAEKSVALIRTLSKTPLARHAPAFFRNLSEDSGLSSFDILDKTRTPIGVINEDDIFHWHCFQSCLLTPHWPFYVASCFIYIRAVQHTMTFCGGNREENTASSRFN